MKDIVIGNRKSESCSATVYHQYPEVQNIISHNSELYWCHPEHIRASIFILKYTNEGKALTDLLISKSNIEDIEAFLIDIALKNMTVSDFREILENLGNNAFRDGVTHNQRQLRKVMGI